MKRNMLESQPYDELSPSYVPPLIPTHDTQESVTEPPKKRRGRRPKSEQQAVINEVANPEDAYRDAAKAFLKARRQLKHWTEEYHKAEAAVKDAAKNLKV